MLQAGRWGKVWRGENVQVDCGERLLMKGARPYGEREHLLMKGARPHGERAPFNERGAPLWRESTF